MNDVNCKLCGEPYSMYSLQHEVSEWDDQPDDAYEQFMSGNGCPTCNWGKKAGDVSLSREESEAEAGARFLKSVMSNSDEDPLKFF